MKRAHTTERVADRKGYVGFRTTRNNEQRLYSLCQELGKTVTDAMNDKLPDVICYLEGEKRRRLNLGQLQPA